MPTPERHIHDRLGSALYRLAALEHRANEVVDSPRAAGKLVREVRKMTAELQRSFSELQDLMGRSARAERTASTAIARANLLFDLSPIACVVLEPVGIVVNANTAAARFLNVSHRHLMGKSFPLFLAGDRDVFMQRIGHLRSGDEAQRWSATLRPRERSAADCVLVGAPDPEERVMLMIMPGTSIEELAGPQPSDTDLSEH